VNWHEVFGLSALAPLFAASIRLAIPLAVAAAGECVAERSGILNLGLEGMMLSGALGAFVGASTSGSGAVGTLTGVAAGVAVAVLVGLFVIRFKIDQVIVGVTTVILCLGFTSYVYAQAYGVGNVPQLPTPTAIHIPGLSSLPGVGPAFFQQHPLVYVGIAVPFVLWWVLRRTRFGLEVRAVGERPDAADANGTHVDRTRWKSLAVAGACAGLAGAILVIGDVGTYRDDITAGRGWIAIAIVIVGRWNPLGALAGSFLFGFTDALQLRVQAAGGGFDTSVPFEFFSALPYAVTLVVVVLTTVRRRRGAQPAALGVPYVMTR
jgi:general nucleoside transport system permease protein